MSDISAFVNNDHDLLDQQWADFLSDVNGVVARKKLFRRFSEHLRRHINFENNELFPYFDRLTGIDPKKGPTAVLRRDHDIILKLLDRVKKAFAFNDDNKINHLGKHLQRAMEKHRERENKIHYSVLDKFISKKEWTKMLENFSLVQD